MRAILLAAGFGTRLQPLTNNTPKCLMPIRGVPLLEIWLERLTKAGIGPFLVNSHYLAEQVEKFIEMNRYRSSVTLTYEKELLGTAGTLISNMHFFQNQDGLLLHADNLCFADFEEFQKAHHNRPSECLMTMMTFRTETPSACGIVELDSRGVIMGFDEKPEKPSDNLANGAIYIISKEMMNILNTQLFSAKDFSSEVLTRFIGRIYTYETKELFVDIGTVKAYEKVNL